MPVRCLCSANLYLAKKMKELELKRTLQMRGRGGGKYYPCQLFCFRERHPSNFRCMQRRHGNQKGLTACFHLLRKLVCDPTNLHWNLLICRSVSQCKEALTLDNLKAIRKLKGVGNTLLAEIEHILVSALHPAASDRLIVVNRNGKRVALTVLNREHFCQRQRPQENSETLLPPASSSAPGMPGWIGSDWIGFSLGLLRCP